MPTMHLDQRRADALRPRKAAYPIFTTWSPDWYGIRPDFADFYLQMLDSVVGDKNVVP